MPSFSPFGWWPDPDDCDVVEFTVSADPGLNQWIHWLKPYGAKWITFKLVNSGAAGGAGMTGLTSTIRGGGGGGGSGSKVMAMAAAKDVPDELYIYVPRGGLPVANAAGSGGSQTIISTRTGLVTNIDLWLGSGGTNAGGGGKGTTAAGAAGTAGLAATGPANMPAWAVQWEARNGLVGTAGSITAAGVNRVYNTNAGGVLGDGGLGGGGATATNTEGPGGTLTGAGRIPNNAGGLASTRGNDGYLMRNGGLIYSVPPSGGGGSAAGTGGQGGSANGAPGSGGAGGGGGITGGQGNEGGPGFCSISSC